MHKVLNKGWLLSVIKSEETCVVYLLSLWNTVGTKVLQDIGPANTGFTARVGGGRESGKYLKMKKCWEREVWEQEGL